MITVQKIIETLDEYIVDLDYSLHKNHLTLKSSNENGFDIEIYFDARESLIYFGQGGFHEHFNHTHNSFEEFIEMLLHSLVGYSRIIEYHWGGKARKFSYQQIEENEEWFTTSKMSFPKWKFWRKNDVIEEKIVQNDYLLVQFSSNKE